MHGETQAEKSLLVLLQELAHTIHAARHLINHQPTIRQLDDVLTWVDRELIMFRSWLARSVYNVVVGSCESFEVDNLGADLAYLMGAVLSSDGRGCTFSSESALVKLFKQHLSRDHPIWLYITLEKGA